MKSLIKINYTTLLVVGLMCLSSSIYGQSSSKSQPDVVSTSSANRQKAEEYVKVARKHLANEMYDVAFAYYTEAIILDPQNVDAYNGRADYYTAIGKNDLAEADRKKVKEIQREREAIEVEVIEKSEGEVQAEEYVESGNDDFANKDLNAAIEDYTKAIKVYPKGFLAYKYRANAYELLGKKALAKVDRQKAKKLEVLVPDVISTVISDKKERARQSIIWGNKHFVEKNYKSAVEFYTQAIENDPQNSKAHKYRANVYEAIGKKDLAEADRKKAKEFGSENYGNPNSVETKQVYKSRPQGVFIITTTASDDYQRAREHYFKKEFGKAILELTTAIKKDPQNTDYYWLRGDAYVEQKDYASAIKDYTKIIELKPQDASFYYHRGKAYLSSKNVDAAFTDFSKSIELAPKSALAYNYRGILNFIKKDYEAAVSDYTKVIELEPQIPTPYINRAGVYEAMGKKDLAEADRKKAGELLSKQP